MKTLCLFILTFLVLYNPKVQADATENGTITVDGAEFELEQIQIKKKNPLKDIDENLESYLEMVKLFKQFKIHNISLSEELLKKLENNNTLSGDDLYQIKRTFEAYYKFNSKMLEFANLYKFKNTTMAKTLAGPDLKLPLVKAHLIWVTANLLTYEHLEDIHKIVYQKDGTFRRIFKSTLHNSKSTKQEKDELKDLTEQVQDIIETVKDMPFANQINLIRNITEDLKTALEKDPNAIALLDDVTLNRISTEIAQGRREFNLEAFGFTDTVVGFFNKITNFLSGFFGNIAGNIKWRKGFLFDSEPAAEIAKNNLRPMDIILEKSPFVLTDKFIPGHFGHVALYLGTREQLEEIGMWNHPDIVPYQDAIESGKTILEAVRSGVRLNTVEDFMNIDEMTIVRKIDGLMSQQQIYEEISRGIDQIGKDYDFNFDISTLDKIVCSELIYIVFGNVKWPTRYRVGRATITPDDVAEVLFMKNTRFKVQSSIVSLSRHRIEMEGISRLADIFEYELRSENGDEMKDPNDPKNSFWKKETKCYNVEARGARGQPIRKKMCQTSYKEFYYEEVGN